MSLRSELAGVDERIAQVGELGLDGLANTAIDQSVEHVAGGYIRTRIRFTKDYLFARNNALFGTRDWPAFAFSLGSRGPVSIKALSIRGAWETYPGGPTTTLSYSLGSSMSAPADIIPAANISAIFNPSSQAEFIDHQSPTEGVFELSNLYLNFQITPVTGVLDIASIIKGTVLDIIWLNLNS